MNKDTRPYYRFAALLPVMEEKSPTGYPVVAYPITTLAESLTQAKELAAGAGLVLLGQLDANNQIMKP